MGLIKRSLLLLMTTAAFSGLAVAEQKQQIDQWEVHYSAFNSTFLTPEIAAQYNIDRSEKRGVVNLSVLDKDTGVAQDVKPKGFVSNPRGGVQTLQFEKITEGEAIYYIASFLFGNEDLMRFEITLPKQGEINPTLEFEQQFYQE